MTDEEWDEHKQEIEREHKKPIYTMTRFFEEFDDLRRGRVEIYGETVTHVTGGLNYYGEGTPISVHFTAFEMTTPEGRKMLYERGVPKEIVLYSLGLLLTRDQNGILGPCRLPEGEA